MHPGGYHRFLVNGRVKKEPKSINELGPLLTQLTFFEQHPTCAEKRSQQLAEAVIQRSLYLQKCWIHSGPPSINHFADSFGFEALQKCHTIHIRSQRISPLGFRAGFRHHADVANHRRALKIDEARWLVQWRLFFISSREVGCYIFFGIRKLSQGYSSYFSQKRRVFSQA